MSLYRSSSRWILALACGAVTSALLLPSARALPRTWIGGNLDWIDGGAATNWNPNDEPDSDDEAIFNTANGVNLGSNNFVNGLTMSGGIDLSLNDFDLTVDGLTQLTGASTNLFIGGASGSLNTDDLAINASAVVDLRGGLLTMDEEAGTSLIDINAGGTLQGNGVISFLDSPLAATTVLSNDGTLTALSRGLTIFSPPPVGTLSIPSAGLSRVDLDGAGEAGVVNINRNQTLDIAPALSDTFNGTMNLSHNSTFQSLSGWSLGTGGSIVINNGFVAGGLGFPDIPADVAVIDGGPLAQSGGTLNVADTDGTFQLDAAFTMTGGTFANSGTVIFNGVTTITTAAGYNPASLNAQTIVNANATINDAAGNFNWDGNGAADTTVNNGVLLSITANQVDTTDNVFGGDIILNGASDLSVNVTATSWTLGGVLSKNDAGTSTVSGDRIVITGVVNANAGTLDLPAVTTSATADFNALGTLTLGSGSELAGGDYDGSGLLRMEGTSTVTADTTIGIDTFDWDGLGSGTSHTINAGVSFAINSATFDSDGDMDDPVNLAGAGSQLLVNGSSQWTMNQTINANNAGAGTALIGGVSRLVLSGASAIFNVNGNTDVGAPLTFGASSSTSIDAGFTLSLSSVVASYVYSGGTIAGAGTFNPGAINTVTADSTINVDSFNFDRGAWTVDNNVILTVNVTDYEPDSLTNSLEGTITINGGGVDFTSGDAFFVMNGTLNLNSGVGQNSTWDGEPIHIGNDAGALDANVNVTGTGSGEFATNAGVTFNSDADVDIAAGSRLAFLSGTPVTFNTVNGANNAQFTGAGEIEFTGAINVNEAVTFNMPGGSVDFDSTDATGAVFNVDAPFTIIAATVQNVGNVNSVGGPDTFDINNSVGTGVLTVNLDSPTAEWTLNGPGVMNLVNDNTEATLLAGNDVNINGTVNVTGDVRTTARLDVAGIININTAGQPLRLGGGSSAPSDSNRLLGGAIGGAGILGADTNTGLRGFGSINTSIDFDSNANLMAEDGTLTITGSIIDVNTLGTGNAGGTLNIPAAWNSANFNGAGSIAAVELNGGTLQGGTITNDGVNGVAGFGLVTSRIINNQGVSGRSGTLVFQTAANDNDWDGTTNLGQLRAAVSSTLELRDNATFAFTGGVIANSGSRVFTNGFALDFNPGSTISLTSGTYESTSSTDIGGTVTVGAGAQSTIKVANNFFLTFESGSNTTLNANLQLLNNNINIEAGATFSGAGALVIPDGSHMVADNLASIGTLLNMDGAFRPGNFNGIGRIDLFDYQQSDAGELYIELIGTGLNQFDRLVAGGDVIVDGYLNLDIDEVSPGVPFVPTLGQTFNIITGNTVSGTFDTVDNSGMPAGLTLSVSYLSNLIRLQVVSTPNYAADFDNDGDVDMTDLAIWQGAFNLNQLGDANGDNITDGSDWTIWRDTFGSTPLVAVTRAVPEPASLGLLGSAFLLLRRRRDHCPASVSTGSNGAQTARRPSRTGLVAGATVAGIGALASTAVANPVLSVTNNGLNGANNREWLVRVAPDPALFVNGDGSLAVELGFNIIGGGQLVGATVNAAAWPWNLPGRNPFTGSNTIGLQVNTTSDTVFASLGSNLFNSGALVQVLKIETLGSGPMTLTWGGHNFGTYIGSRISQGGQNFNSYQGSINAIGLPGDFDLDGDLDATDIDLLFAAQQGPVPPANAIFDVTGNNSVNSLPNSPNSDADRWVRVLRDTEYGDANLDGTIGFDDLLLVAQNYGQPTGGWAAGSFDGQVGIDFDDLLLLAQNYGFVTLGSSDVLDSSPAFSADWALAQSMVPEPTSLVFLAAVGVMARRR